MRRTGLTIGRLARDAAVSVETVRYYERVGLVTQPRKPLEGYRRYPPEDVQRIRFIKRAQRLGFHLQEIGELLELGDGRCRDVLRRAEDKRAQIQTQLQDLLALRATLDALIRASRAGRDGVHCPLVQALAAEREPDGRARRRT